MEAKHCPDCRNEFIASVDRCTDCGEPLRPGELPRVAAAAGDDDEVESRPHGEAPAMPEPPDTLIATLPGEDAERVARALSLEGISSLLDCEGTQELRGPNEPPKPAIARRKPVDIHVAHARVDEVREIIDSLIGVDLIGEQWRSDDADVHAAAAEEEEDPAPRSVDVPRASAELAAPSAEGNGRYFVLLAVAGAVVALFIALL